MRTAAAVAVCLALGASCRSTDVVEPAPAKPQPAAAPDAKAEAKGEAAPEAKATAGSPDTKTADRMRHHFDAISQIKSAVIDGDVEGSHEAASAFLDRPTKGPAAWTPHVAQLRVHVEEVVQAKELTAVASATAKVGAACGACHLALKIEPKFDGGTPPDPGDEAHQHMARHQWAADRMWEGLVSPTSTVWTQGVEAFEATSSCPKSVHVETASAKKIEGLRKEVHEVATKAKGAKDLDARATAYGQFLNTCSTCHTSGC